MTPHPRLRFRFGTLRGLIEIVLAPFLVGHGPGTPSLPYGGYTMSLASVEQNMRLRRGRLLSALKQDPHEARLHWKVQLGALFTIFVPRRLQSSKGDLCPGRCVFGCFGRKMTGLPGGLIIYQGYLFALKAHLCPS